MKSEKLTEIVRVELVLHHLSKCADADTDHARIAYLHFDEPQEGDWVQLSSPNSAIPVAGYVTHDQATARYGEIYIQDHARAFAHPWHVTAFKPLRQVVEELATKCCKGTLDIVTDSAGYTAVKIHRTNGEIYVLWANERGALLATKETLETLIAQANKT